MSNTGNNRNQMETFRVQNWHKEGRVKIFLDNGNKFYEPYIIYKSLKNENAKLSKNIY